MKILVIKQTSLGDVLHSTGHIRTIKDNFPTAHLTLLTATTSADIYRNNPRVDRIILFDRYRIKRNWWRHPILSARHVNQVIQQVRADQFDLAFDLQGLTKSVLFLYSARAKRKFVKGNWWGIEGFRDRSLHAIAEMDAVLASAGLAVTDSSMEFFTSRAQQQAVNRLLREINPQDKPILVMSPFSRWRSKDWPLERYIEVAANLEARVKVIITGSEDRRRDIDNALGGHDVGVLSNLAGELTIPEFAELVGRASLMLSGDSFPMHVACARKTPVVALFGPTDENKVGPTGSQHQVIRAPDCDCCDRPDCPRNCLKRIVTDSVMNVLNSRLGQVDRG